MHILFPKTDLIQNSVMSNNKYTENRGIAADVTRVQREICYANSSRSVFEELKNGI